MNIHIKSPEEIEIMAKGGKILSDTLFAVLEHAKPGVTELELDALADELIRKAGAEPGFKKVPGYHHATCISTNDVVVHGIPGNYKLKEGDVIGIDCGVFLEGFHTDMSETRRVSNSKLKTSFDPELKTEGQNSKEDEVDNFLDTGRKALNLAISQVKPGNRVGHISKTIQTIVEGAGYSIVRELIGHGVGRELHEDPPVPGYLDKKIENTPLLTPGMTIAVEIIYNMGKKEVVYRGTDDWTIVAKDASISGLFERTLAVTEKGFRLLTPEVN